MSSSRCTSFRRNEKSLIQGQVYAPAISPQGYTFIRVKDCVFFWMSPAESQITVDQVGAWLCKACLQMTRGRWSMCLSLPVGQQPTSCGVCSCLLGTVDYYVSYSIRAPVALRQGCKTFPAGIEDQPRRYTSVAAKQKTQTSR